MADTITGAVAEFVDEGKKQVGQLVKPVSVPQSSISPASGLTSAQIAGKEEDRQKQLAMQRQTINQAINQARQNRNQPQNGPENSHGIGNATPNMQSRAIKTMPQDLEAILKQKRQELVGSKNRE